MKLDPIKQKQDETGPTFLSGYVVCISDRKISAEDWFTNSRILVWGVSDWVETGKHKHSSLSFNSIRRLLPYVKKFKGEVRRTLEAVFNGS